MLTRKDVTGKLAWFILAAVLPLTAQTNWAIQKTLQVGGAGGWDYVTLDAANHRLYVTRTTHTMVLDSQSGAVIGDITGQKISHGVAIVPEVGRGFITDRGGSGAIVVFDVHTNQVLGTLAAQPDADGIIYDKGSNLVLAVSGDGGVLMTFKPDIDPVHGKIGSPIQLGGSPEYLAADGAGKVYINLEDKDELAVVDLHARKVLAHWPVAPGGQPVGLALGPSGRELYIGCRKPQMMIVMSTDGGKVLASLPIGAGVDATRVDGDQAFASCRDGSLVVVSGVGAKVYKVAQVVKTPDGARTMAIDTVTHTIYLPTAELLPPAKPGARPQAKPGTFMIVVVQRKP